jgi:hypothetical protein
MSYGKWLAIRSGGRAMEHHYQVLRNRYRDRSSDDHLAGREALARLGARGYLSACALPQSLALPAVRVGFAAERGQPPGDRWPC